MIYYNAPHVRIFWDDTTECVVLQWNGFVHDKMVYDALNRALYLFIEKDAQRWLSDLRKVKVWGEKETKWINEDFFPRLFATGLRKLAYVIPESALAHLSLTRQMRHINGQVFKTAYFSDPNEAKRWLREG